MLFVYLKNAQNIFVSNSKQPRARCDFGYVSKYRYKEGSEERQANVKGDGFWAVGSSFFFFFGCAPRLAGS